MAQTRVMSTIASGDGLTPAVSARGRRAGLAALAVAVVLAAILRVLLSQSALWFDEYASLFFAGQPLSRLWSGWMVRETNPPLFYTVLRGWLLLPVPVDRFWLRIPSIVASLLVLPVVYSGLNRTYGTKAAVTAVLMLAVSAQQIFFAEQVRCYSLLFLALAVSLFGILAIATSVERAQRVPTGAWLAYGGGAVAAIYLHTTAIFWPVIATVSLIAVVPPLRPFVGRLWLKLVLVDGLIAIGASWWLYITIVQTLHPNSNITWMHYDGLKASARTFLSATLLLRDAEGWQWLTTLLLCALALFGAVRTRQSMATRLVVTCWLVTLVLYVVVSHKQAIIVEKTIVWIAIFPTILVAAGLGTLRAPWRFASGAGLVLLLIGVNLALASAFSYEDWQRVVVAVARDRDGALVASGEGVGVVVDQACEVAFHRRGCPFPLVTLENSQTNPWAKGYAPAVPSTAQHTLALPAQTRLYFVQRLYEKPIRQLQQAGMALPTPPEDTALVGPYARLVPQLEGHSRVQDGILIPIVASGKPLGR